MSFTTKKYTRPVLINELRRVNARQYTSLSNFASAFSPRAGSSSAKLSALKSIVTSTQLRDVFSYTSGREAKTLIISLVKNA